MSFDRLKELKKWKEEVQNFLLVNKTGIEYRKLRQELLDLLGVPVPYEKLGFRTWGDFLFAISDVFSVGHEPGESTASQGTRFFLFIKEDVVRNSGNKDLKDVAAMVKGQDSSRKRNGPPTRRQVIFCSPGVLRGKDPKPPTMGAPDLCSASLKQALANGGRRRMRGGRGRDRDRSRTRASSSASVSGDWRQRSRPTPTASVSEGWQARSPRPQPLIPTPSSSRPKPLMPKPQPLMSIPQPQPRSTATATPSVVVSKPVWRTPTPIQPPTLPPLKQDAMYAPKPRLDVPPKSPKSSDWSDDSESVAKNEDRNAGIISKNHQQMIRNLCSNRSMRNGNDGVDSAKSRPLFVCQPLPQPPPITTAGFPFVPPDAEKENLMPPPPPSTVTAKATRKRGRGRPTIYHFHTTAEWGFPRDVPVTDIYQRIIDLGLSPTELVSVSIKQEGLSY